MTRARRALLALCLAGLPGLTSVAQVKTAAPAKAAALRPNILVIVTDDQRATGTMRWMPQTRKWFERQGRRYSNAFSTTPLCCPARASIFSGRYAHNHGVRRSNEAENLDQTTTMQRYLQDAGYSTATFGKYLNFWPLSIDPPYFDEWAIFSNTTPSGYYGGPWNVSGRVRYPTKYGTKFIADRGMRFLRRAERTDDERSWFLYLATGAPHKPYIPQEKYETTRIESWDGNPAVPELDRSDKPEFIESARATLSRAQMVRRRQIRTLLSVDDLVGNVVRTMQELDEGRATLAFFMSDNGFMWAEHGRIGKTLPYSPSVRIPMMVRWPRHVARGQTDRRLVANIDVAPTALKAAGLDAAASAMDGRSTFDPFERDRILLESWQSAMPWASLWNADPAYQYTEYYGETGGVAFQEYYDASDPWQLANPLGDDDPFNDPDWRPAARQLDADRNCRAFDCP